MNEDERIEYVIDNYIDPYENQQEELIKAMFAACDPSNLLFILPFYYLYAYSMSSKGYRSSEILEWILVPYELGNFIQNNEGILAQCTPDLSKIWWGRQAIMYGDERKQSLLNDEMLTKIVSDDESWNILYKGENNE